MKLLYSTFLFISVIANSSADGSGAAENYMLQCQGCHLADGSGLSTEVPDFDLYLNSFLGVPGGRAYLVQVPGSANAPLTARELADVLNWIVMHRPGAKPPARFTPYTASEVAVYKAAGASSQPAVLRAELLEQIHQLQ